MSGWKQWQALEFVDADDFQSYLQNQVFLVFDSSSARSSALGTAVIEGMVSYLKDSNSTEVYNGTSWQGFATGDITSVVAGTGLAGGGVSGDVTLNVNYSAVGSAITIGKTQVSGTAVVLSDTSVVTNAMLQNSSISINGSPISLGGTVTVGDITSVTAGTGLTGGGTTGDVTINANYAAIGSAITIGKTQVTGTAVVVADLASASVSYALTSGTAVYANTSGTAAYGTLAGTAVYANNAGTAVYATNAGTAVYATLAGTAVYATNAGTAVFATTAGTATPSAHASTHGAAGSDPVTIAKTQVTGTAVVLSDTSVITNAMLQNSSVTINGSPISLGGTVTVGDITSVTAGTGLTGGGTTGDLTLNADYAAIGSAITIGKTQVSGTAVVLTDTGVVTNTMLQNSSITLNGTAVALGGTATISGGGASGEDDQIILPVQIFS